MCLVDLFAGFLSIVCPKCVLCLCLYVSTWTHYRGKIVETFIKNAYRKIHQFLGSDGPISPPYFYLIDISSIFYLALNPSPIFFFFCMFLKEYSIFYISAKFHVDRTKTLTCTIFFLNKHYVFRDIQHHWKNKKSKTKFRML